MLAHNISYYCQNVNTACSNVQSVGENFAMAVLFLFYVIQLAKTNLIIQRKDLITFLLLSMHWFQTTLTFWEKNTNVNIKTFSHSTISRLVLFHNIHLVCFVERSYSVASFDYSILKLWCSDGATTFSKTAFVIT